MPEEHNTPAVCGWKAPGRVCFPWLSRTSRGFWDSMSLAASLDWSLNKWNILREEKTKSLPAVSVR
jgi:hypothetical protein